MRVPDSPPQAFATGVVDASLIQTIASSDVRKFVREMNERYIHWDKFRHRPMPSGLSSTQGWAAMELSRIPQFQTLPITFGQNRELRFWIPPQHHEWLSTVDQQAAGVIGGKHPATFPDDNDRYLFNSLMEEAIASSQLEGATTTRKVAKEMLRSNRRPRDKAEQMIVNNYQAILDIRDRRNDPLTPGLLRHLQKVLTDKTLDHQDGAGRFRRDDEAIHVVDSTTSETLHEPPPASVVEKRVEEICEFANATSTPFVHPVVKAIALHFAIGYVHPFVDGNGRTARAVFFWYMLRRGFWLFEYLPVSRLIAASPTKYGRSYLYVETDGGDLTYFNHFNLQLIVRAIHDLHQYLAEQHQLLGDAHRVLESHPSLNHRQRLLIQSALKHPEKGCSFAEYSGEHRVSYNTARSDLAELESLGLIERVKGRKEVLFVPAPDLHRRLDSRPSRRRRPAR
jgi:Fic family protein